MASLYVQDVGQRTANTAPSSTTNVAVTNAPAVQNMVLAEVVINGSGTLNSITDPRSNLWTLVKVIATGTPVTRIYQYYTFQNVSKLLAADNVAFNVTVGTATSFHVQLRELDADRFDSVTLGSNINNVAGTSMTVSTAASTTQATEITWVTFGAGAAQASWTADGAYSLPTSNLINDGTNLRALMSEYRDVTTAGSQTATGTIASAVYGGIISTWYRSTAPLPAFAPVPFMPNPSRL